MRNNNQPTAITTAFMRLPDSVLNTSLGQIIFKTLTKVLKGYQNNKGWDANVSFKTYRHLSSKGVLA